MARIAQRRGFSSGGTRTSTPMETIPAWALPGAVRSGPLPRPPSPTEVLEGYATSDVRARSWVLPTVISVSAALAIEVDRTANRDGIVVVRGHELALGVGVAGTRPHPRHRRQHAGYDTAKFA
jgi:hypothetical protein